MKRAFRCTLFSVFLLSQPCLANEWSFSGRAEKGAIAAQSHNIQFSKDGSKLDYTSEDGEQNILFDYERFEAIATSANGHQLQFLYQPLEIVTQPVLTRDIQIDGLTFKADTPVEMRYSFPFYRLSYLSLTKSESSTYGYGFSAQIRNASIAFSTTDGSQRRISQNVGPVPTLKFFYKTSAIGMWQVAAELDTIYAPVKYLNGSQSDVVGAFTDFSLKSVYSGNTKTGLSPFVCLRYIGGGAEGTSDQKQAKGDGFTSNWIDLTSFSLGLEGSV